MIWVEAGQCPRPQTLNEPHGCPPSLANSLLVYLSQVILLIRHLSHGSTRKKNLFKSQAVSGKSVRGSFIEDRK